MKQVFNFELDYTPTNYCDSTEGICVVNNGNVQFYYAVTNPQFRGKEEPLPKIIVFDDLMALIDYFAYNAEHKSYKDTQVYKEFCDMQSYARWFDNLQY